MKIDKIMFKLIYEKRKEENWWKGFVLLWSVTNWFYDLNIGIEITKPKLYIIRADGLIYFVVFWWSKFLAAIKVLKILSPPSGMSGSQMNFGGNCHQQQSIYFLINPSELFGHLISIKYEHLFLWNYIWQYLCT